MADNETDTGAPARNHAADAIEVLSQQNSGLLLVEVGEELSEIARLIRERGRGSGKVTIVLELKAATKGGGKAVTMSGTVRATKPKPEIEETIMYVLEDGSLSRRDPRQPELPFGS